MKVVKGDINPVAVNFIENVPNKGYATILADPPWRFLNRTGKVAPEHKRLSRYDTLALEEIKQIPVQSVAGEKSHLYLWVPNALLPDGLEVMKAWGFTYKSNIIWHKIRKDGGPDGRGVGFYFRNTTELVLFGIRGSMRTLDPGRSQVNIIRTQKQENSRKPDELYELIERCSPAPFLEIFARGKRNGWDVFGDQADEYNIDWDTYANHSQSEKRLPVTSEPILALEEPAYNFYSSIGKAPKRSSKK
ncbi:MAG: MT-A70 family methyltransferase [Bacteroidetes bacterium]|nr:MT-A70 family methyltransferase [Bacteroidota bacterium]